MAPGSSSTLRDENLRRMIAHHDAWASTYDADIAGMIIYNRITWDNVRRYLPDDRDGVILDAGGGTGFWALKLAEAGYRVVLADISPGMLDKARENVSSRGLEDRIEVRYADIRSMPEFADDAFAMVVSQGDPVSYCGDHEAAVREFARVVRPGGAVVVSVDSRTAAMGWFKGSQDAGAIEGLLLTGSVKVPLDDDAGYFVHAFTPREIAGLFESNGLSVERIIGKRTISRYLGLASSDDPAVLEHIYRIESQYCDDPAWYPLGGHLEIAGRKR